MIAVAPFTLRVGFFGLLLTLVSVVGISAHSTSPAVATTSPSSLRVYLDAPFVQGSYVADPVGGDPNVLSTSFNGPTGANQCGDGAPAGITISGACQVYSAASHGGATTLVTDATPTVGGAGSNFASTNHPTTQITITLTNESRYMGLWWPSGSDGNVLRFYNDSVLLLTVTNDDVIALLGSQGSTEQSWLDRNNDTSSNVITSTGGTNYRKAWYFGNPRGYASTSPTSWAGSSWTPTQPFVYIHMFAGGNLTFDEVQLSGSGFEFDNLAVSTTAQTPDPRLVLVSTFVREHTVTFLPNGSDVEGTMPPQVRTTTGPLSTNAFERNGFTFGGWATEADGSGTRFADGASYDLDVDLTLHARWIADSAPRSGSAIAEEPAETPPLTEVGESLAATGSSTPGLVGLSVLSTLVGFALIALSRVWRLQQRATPRI